MRRTILTLVILNLFLSFMQFENVLDIDDQSERFEQRALILVTLTSMFFLAGIAATSMKRLKHWRGDNE